MQNAGADDPQHSSVGDTFAAVLGTHCVSAGVRQAKTIV